MKYMGSKARHAKNIVPILESLRKPNQTYIEPFVGGANIIDKMSGERIGYDLNHYLITMWQAVSKGWLPPETFREDEYKYYKENKPLQDPNTGYAGFALSYGAMFFSSYRKDKVEVRDYAGESYRSAVKQFPKLRGVKFENKSVFDLNLFDALVYCDPPYKDTAKYSTGDFDHERFYTWCRKMKSQGNTIVVSEYQMPDDFKCIWQKEVNSSLGKDTGSKKAVEKLFILE